jgi:hypothetical protein
MKMEPRSLSQGFEQALLSGRLAPLLALVQKDRDLIAEIREDRLDIYCKGNRVVSVSPRRDESFGLSGTKKFWPTGRQSVSQKAEVEEFCKKAGAIH